MPTPEPERPADEPPLELTAFEVSAGPVPLRAASGRRQWMDDTHERFAYRCLPLVIANQIGWEALCPADFSASWNGSDALDGVRLAFDGAPSPYVSSHFGSGVLTFSLGYLFRTPPGHNLWCKGPANEPRDGIAPLEGVIETDWSPFTFTMNWKFTRPGHAVRFRRGEPIATLLPLPRAYLGRFDPVIRPIARDAELQRDYDAWRQSRSTFNRELREPDSPAREQAWQRSYMLGQDPRQRRFEEHETKLQLPGFRRDDQA